MVRLRLLPLWAYDPTFRLSTGTVAVKAMQNHGFHPHSWTDPFSSVCAQMLIDLPNTL
ncbi:hypothetical protein [Stenomitos frigidus]|uniref:hypothetical protein n=1 Tax=Stenomitos frigidus TaxID=1886765 RepID=UPI0015E79FD9|nr:hypothetical protein [Stenomitos frigidus]